MRFLKNKIAKAQEALEQRFLEAARIKEKMIIQTPIIEQSISKEVKEETQPKKRRRIEGLYFTSEKARSTKNVVKNYGKAICSFAVSDLALPYLNPIIMNENVKLEDFVHFVSSIKETIESIQSFRTVLLESEDDKEEIKAFRRIFASIGEVFIKYFSVNWIFSGRVTHKDAHLKFRFKMLRRIKNPENFTYIQKNHRAKN